MKVGNCKNNLTILYHRITHCLAFKIIIPTYYAIIIINNKIVPIAELRINCILRCRSGKIKNIQRSKMSYISL